MKYRLVNLCSFVVKKKSATGCEEEGIKTLLISALISKQLYDMIKMYKKVALHSTGPLMFFDSKYTLNNPFYIGTDCKRNTIHNK